MSKPHRHAHRVHSATRTLESWARLCLAAVAFTPVPVFAQEDGPVAGDTVRVTPGRSYDAGMLHRLLLGDLHRTLWATPVNVPVLDLDTFAGGLTPIRRGGGQQTRSLRLRGRDGVTYMFRVIDKDASRTLDPELRRSIAAAVLQDQVGALLPLGALVVAPLLEAVGVLHAKPRLAVLPYDERLGEYVDEFAGVPGFLEERPDEGSDGQPGFAGSTRVVGSPRLFERLEEDPMQRVDARAFLRARLLDIFVGDSDRHPDQWRWAAFDEEGVTVFQPVPRDRDYALAHIDGWLPGIAAYAFPNYVGFGRDYPSAFSLTWSGRALDRRLLAGLERAAWDEVVADLIPRLNDATIERAVRALPEPYYARIGASLTEALIRRRDELPDMAREFYELLAGWVDIETTDADEIATHERVDSRTLRVDIRTAESGTPVFSRTFHADETREVRVFLKGGPDRAIVRGVNDGDITLHINGGGNDDTYIDETGGAGAYFYDDRGDNVIQATGTEIDDESWEQPEDPSSDTHMAKARDWGARWIPVPSVAAEPDLGLYVGAGAIRWGYGFRHYPWRTRLAFSLGFGTTTGLPRASIDYDTPLVGDVRVRLRGYWSGVERGHFYGFGNETREQRDRKFFRVDRYELGADAMLTVQPTPAVELGAGPLVQRVRHRDNEGTLFDSVSPYGSGDFDQVGVLARIAVDGRDRRLAPSRGGAIFLDGRVFPSLLDVESTYGGVRGEARGYVTARAPLSPTIALRVGGQKVWGEPPYFDAAYLGGSGTIRGFSRQRFFGHAAAFANAELRLRVTDLYLFLPGTFGVFGLADTGRVYAHGEESDRWHSAFGGGIWLSFLGPANTMSLAVADSRERTGVYLTTGFHF